MWEAEVRRLLGQERMGNNNGHHSIVAVVRPRNPTRGLCRPPWPTSARSSAPKRRT